MACIKIIMSLILATSYHSPNAYKISKNICRWSEIRNLDPYMVMAVIKHESNFRARLISKTRDYGLMQLNYKYSRAKCNLLKIECNIREGTKFLARIRYNCIKNHKHKYWLRHYNWNSRRHYLNILWITKAYKSNNPKLLEYIKKRKYMKLKINHKCLKEGYCCD